MIRRTQPAEILMLGPSPSEVGGMATVVDQMTQFLGDNITLLPTTRSTGKDEEYIAKVIRHVGHFVRYVRKLRQHRLVYIHTCSGLSFYRDSVAAMIAKLLRRRVILHVHGGAFEDFVTGAGYVRQTWIRRSLEIADRVVALSDGWRRRISRIAPRAAIEVLANGVSIPASAVKSLEGERCRFLLLGRMDCEKGIDDVLSAFSMLRGEALGASVVLAGPAGSAGDAARMTQKIERLGLADVVQYVGEVDASRKESLFATTGAYLQVSHFEGMPIAVLEAMARGTPVIATRVGALPEMIQDDVEGLLVPPRDPPKLATAIRRMLSDADGRRQMGVAARRRAMERFSKERFENEADRILNRVLSQRATTTSCGFFSSNTSEPLAELMCSARGATLR